MSEAFSIPSHFMNFITVCDLMWYSECQGPKREKEMPLTVNTAVHLRHRWVMCQHCCLSWPKVKEKVLVTFPWRADTFFHNSKVTLLMGREILPKVCSAAWIRLMKHESELVHARTDREGERELVLPPVINHTTGITPGEGFVFQIFKSGTIKTWTFLSEH